MIGVIFGGSRKVHLTDAPSPLGKAILTLCVRRGVVRAVYREEDTEKLVSADRRLPGRYEGGTCVRCGDVARRRG